MTSSAVLSEIPAQDADDEPTCESAPGRTSLSHLLAEVQAMVPPVWPLRDYVAVNPFLGMSHQPFLAARQQLRAVRDCELLPQDDYFQELLDRCEITRDDAQAALAQCVTDYPQWFSRLSVEQILQGVGSEVVGQGGVERRYWTLSEVVDQRLGTKWTSHIVNDITRHCSAHYDEGQAAWGNPWQDLPLYAAWRESACRSRRMDLLGIRGFQQFISRLPSTPEAAIEWILDQLDISPSRWQPFLLAELFSVAGWASFVRYRVREAEMAGRRDEDLIGLLAIRLVYDLALADSYSTQVAATTDQLVSEALSDDDTVLTRIDSHGDATNVAAKSGFAQSVLVRYTLQVAAEIAHRKKLTRQLTMPRTVAPSTQRKLAQMVFCIDVRSEVMRRHLESLSSGIETMGFAGFFGMALEYVPLGEKSGPCQCPVLLRPSFQVQETVVGASAKECDHAVAARREKRTGRKVWKSFQTSAVSCFSFVESLGPWYLGKMLSDSLRWTRPIGMSERDGIAGTKGAVLGPDVCDNLAPGLTPEKKVDLAEGMLRNLGLTQGFARVVAICGHASEVVNNPYRAGLDCGACGGHSGEPNARVAASLLNDANVRAKLSERGIEIPADTWFVPAVHNTTTDELRFLDTESLPPSHGDDFAQLRQWSEEAGRLSRVERSVRLRGATADTIAARSKDWSEVRPEWGLAGNAAFIVAPRSRTSGLDLCGRTFLHSYDHRQDPELKVLELIMTAPMIVTSWINLQYYASAVDNRSFGSGNKAIHNVVGQFGVLSGNGGDLMTGLPWQSVHDGERLQHAPLRLLVVIEATRSAVAKIIHKHSAVRDLVSNGWISLVVLEDEHLFRWTTAGEWEGDSSDESP